jgi:hypothetical protein
LASRQACDWESTKAARDTGRTFAGEVKFLYCGVRLIRAVQPISNIQLEFYI